MRIALTGSTGFIGGGIFQLLHSSHEIMRLGRRDEYDIYVDFADIRTMTALDLTGCDVLIHCAGVVDEDFVNSPQHAWSQAIAGAEELARRALASGIQKMIYFSTTHVYGAFQGTISEDSIPNPLSHYAIAHYATEQILKSYARKGLKVFIIRPNAVYGVPANWNTFDRWELVPYDLPLQAAYKQKIVLKTAGEQKRNFIALEDLVGYVEKLLTFPVNGETFILNAVGSETLRIVDFAQMCADVYHDSTGRVCEIERPSGVSVEYVKDFQLVSKHSGFIPLRDTRSFLRDFLKQVIENEKRGVIYGKRG